MVEKMRERQISWPIYIMAFIITLTIFVAGLFIGNTLSSNVDSQMVSELRLMNMKVTEMELLNMIGDEKDQCIFYKAQFAAFDKDTTDFGSRLDVLEKTREGRSDVVINLKREFQVMQVRDYLLTTQIAKKCNEKIDSILFFYTNQNCPDCTKQGLVGPSLKQEKPGVMIYALDSDFDSPLVTALEKKFGVEKFPSMVINGKLNSGFIGEEEILKQLG